MTLKPDMFRADFQISWTTELPLLQQIPPHNLEEVINGVVAYIADNKISLEEMMTIIKAPDFPTGGIIIAG